MTGLNSRYRSLKAAAGLLLMVMLLVSACGGQVNQSAAGTATSSTDGIGAEAAAMRTIQDAYGETSIPASPKRIIVLSTLALESMLSLGIKPVGAPYSIPDNAKFFAHLEKQTEGVQNIGTVDQPNLETIARLNPDLIIAQKEENEAIYQDLKRIAPVYMASGKPNEWKKLFLGHAEALGKQEEGTRLVTAYEQKVAKFQADMGSRLNEKTVMLIRPRADHVRLQMQGSFSGSVVAEAGLKRPGAYNASKEHNIKITEEQIAEMDSDFIISFGREHEADFFNTKIKTNPVWKTLTAVKNGEVYYTNWEVWLSGQGIQSANLIIDDLNRIFIK
ncbi:ABC transporter substrate-binding protein [Paenibacillus sp. y28]|uniref:ABC transporter substrate-binding protein n=1 Tax=Paenibacillus sp. y28 TaxID=3129110 RepID=UPI0030170600